MYMVEFYSIKNKSKIKLNHLQENGWKWRLSKPNVNGRRDRRIDVTRRPAWAAE